MFYIEDKNFLNKNQKKFIEEITTKSDFPYYVISNSTENDSSEYLSHIIKNRIEDFPNEKCNSNYYPQITDILFSFLIKNKIKIKQLCRAAVNLTYNNGKEKCNPHHDHKYEHKQFILYLNDPIDKNSKTVILDKSNKVFKEVTPEQYKGICFDSHLHYHYYPKKGRRIILIATFK
tara:strand:+ start:1526 stop:2053 length:528 start_codon:yes stop_codon:yes gene_type:complete